MYFFANQQNTTNIVETKMKDSKLIRAIKTLDQEELRLFKRFLQSKFFNQHQLVTLLFDYLRNQLKRKHPNWSKEAAYLEITGEKSFKNKPMRDVMSYLFKLLNQFLVYREMHDSPTKEGLELCKAYRKRNLLKLFESNARKTELLNQNAPTQNVDYLRQKYLLEQEKYYAIIQKGRAKATNLQEVSDSLDISYFANRLRQSSIMLAHQSVYNTAYQTGLTKEVLNEVEQRQLYHIPAIGLYYYYYKAQTNSENLEYFKLLQTTLAKHASLFDALEIRDIYLLGINIGIKNLNQGNADFVPVLLEIYKSGIEQKILYNSETLSRFTFKNVIALALGLKQYEWVKNFIEEQVQFLDPQTKDSSYQYNLAKLHYCKGEYGKALKLLVLTTSSDDVYMSLDTKILLTRIHYEQENFDALESLINSFKSFIRRKKIISYHRESYRNFLNCLIKLTNVNPFDKTAKKTLRDEIKQLQALPEKDWFLLQLK